MEESADSRSELVVLDSIFYSKEISWTIANIIAWWSSRDVVASNRNENTTEDEEMDYEYPKDWNKSSTSPIVNFSIEGVDHQFKIAILKYDSWDRYDDVHDVMMGISLFYNGPFESVNIKPLFYLEDSYTRKIHNNTRTYNHKRQFETLRKGMYSSSTIFSGDNHISHLDPGEECKVFCSVTIILNMCSSTMLPLLNQVKSKKARMRSLLDGLCCPASRQSIERFSDFEVVCLENGASAAPTKRILRCHRLVLSLGCEYFERMFCSNFTENRGIIEVTDVSGDTMAKILQYIYSGDLPISEIDIEVFYAADKYQLEYLKAICEAELGKNITVEEAPELALAANMCGTDAFKCHVYGYIRNNWDKMKATTGAELIAKNAEILSEIMDRATVKSYYLCE